MNLQKICQFLCHLKANGAQKIDCATHLWYRSRKKVCSIQLFGTFNVLAVPVRCTNAWHSTVRLCTATSYWLRVTTSLIRSSVLPVCLRRQDVDEVAFLNGNSTGVSFSLVFQKLQVATECVAHELFSYAYCKRTFMLVAWTYSKSESNNFAVFVPDPGLLQLLPHALAFRWQWAFLRDSKPSFGNPQLTRTLAVFWSFPGSSTGPALVVQPLWWGCLWWQPEKSTTFGDVCFIFAWFFFATTCVSVQISSLDRSFISQELE